MRTWMRIAAIAALVAAPIAGCGDDDDDAASKDEFCSISAQIDERFDEAFEGLPDDADEDDFGPVVQQVSRDILDEFRDDAEAAAPDEISDDVETLFEANEKAADGDTAAFEDPSVEAADDRVTEFCGGEPDDDDAEASAIPEPFFGEAEAICATANEKIDAIFDDLFGGEEPSAEEMHELLNAALDIHEAEFDEIRALDSFPDDAEIVAAFDQMDAAETEVRERAATPEGTAAFFENVDEDDPIREAEEHLAELGFDECAAQGDEAEAFEGTDLTDEQRAAATELDVSATEFTYEGVPADLPAGPLVLRFTNAGDLEHEIGIVKIKDGTSAEDAIAKAKADKDDESYIDTFVGGAFSPPEADGAEFTDVLEPGLYGYACFVETDDGQTHASLGMIGTFEAT